MSLSRVTLPKSVIRGLGNVPFDVFEPREGVAAALTLNLKEELGCVGGKWTVYETSGLNAVTITVDRTKVYTVNAGAIVASEIIVFDQIIIGVGVAGVVNLYIEGWSLELLEELGKKRLL